MLQSGSQTVTRLWSATFLAYEYAILSHDIAIVEVFHQHIV